MTVALYMFLGLAAATLDGVGVVYLRRRKYVNAVVQIGCGFVLELLSVPCVAAKVYASLASVSAVVAVVCSRDVRRGFEYGCALTLMIVGTISVAYVSRNDANAAATDLPVWVYLALAAVPISSLHVAAKALRCHNPKMMRPWEKILLIVADSAVATLNLSLMETMTRCSVWIMFLAVALLTAVNFYTTSASLRVNSVTLHAPIFLVLYLVGGMMLDRQLSSVSIPQLIIPAICLVGGLVLVLYYEERQ